MPSFSQSTPTFFHCITFKKFSVAQGWASVEQRGANLGPPEAARAQRSAGHRGGLGHRGRSMSGHLGYAAGYGSLNPNEQAYFLEEYRETYNRIGRYFG